MILLCLKIFFARLVDVTLGTVKTMFIVKGDKIISTVVAFFEILIWYFAAREAINTNTTSLFIIIAYALGYSAGTYIGIIINDAFIDGIINVQVISSTINKRDIEVIKKNNFGVSVLKTVDNKYMLFLEVNKKRVRECTKLIKEIDQDSFIIINDSKLAYNGYIKK